MKKQKQESLLGQIAVPVVVALLTGTTYPFWVKLLFPNVTREPENVVDSINPHSDDQNNASNIYGTYIPINKTQSVSESELAIAENFLAYNPNQNCDLIESETLEIKLLPNAQFSFEAKDKDDSNNEYIFTRARGEYITKNFFDTAVGKEASQEQINEIESEGFIAEKVRVVDFIPSKVTSGEQEIQDFSDLQAMIFYHEKYESNFMSLLGASSCTLKKAI